MRALAAVGDGTRSERGEKHRIRPGRFNAGVFQEIEPRPDVDPVLRRVGLFLRRKRHERAMTQTSLSYRAGVPQSAISRAERGLQPALRLSAFARLLDELGVLDEPPPRAWPVDGESFWGRR